LIFACRQIDDELKTLPQFKVRIFQVVLISIGWEYALMSLSCWQLREELIMGVGREAKTVVNRRMTADDTSGSTAIISVITPTFICTANLGDSRAVLLSSSGGERLVATALSDDQKPNSPGEKQRIESAGGIVKPVEVPSGDESKPPEIIWRLFLKEGSKESLALSRAFGDFLYKTNPDKNLEEQMVGAKAEAPILS